MYTVISAPLPARVSSPAHPLITIQEAAALLGCSGITIRRRVEARQFPAVKIGTKALVPRAFIEALVADAVAGRTVIVEEYAQSWAERSAS
jgi:excisionase family DNA binding protein